MRQIALLAKLGELLKIASNFYFFETKIIFIYLAKVQFIIFLNLMRIINYLNHKFSYQMSRLMCEP
jgi:hypothetical protein